MAMQASTDVNTIMPCQPPNVEIVTNDHNSDIIRSSCRRLTGFSFPVFSKNKRYAVIRKYYLSGWDANSGYYDYDACQTFYYENIKSKGWVCIFKGYLVLF
jgi:hypothetical protein